MDVPCHPQDCGNIAAAAVPTAVVGFGILWVQECWLSSVMHLCSGTASMCACSGCLLVVGEGPMYVVCSADHGQAKVMLAAKATPSQQCGLTLLFQRSVYRECCLPGADPAEYVCVYARDNKGAMCC